MGSASSRASRRFSVSMSADGVAATGAGGAPMTSRVVTTLAIATASTDPSHNSLPATAQGIRKTYMGGKVVC
jgi:hypothetical protein